MILKVLLGFMLKILKVAEKSHICDKILLPLKIKGPICILSHPALQTFPGEGACFDAYNLVTLPQDKIPFGGSIFSSMWVKVKKPFTLEGIVL